MFGIKSTDVSLKEVRCFQFPNHAIFSFSEKDVVNPDVQHPFACFAAVCRNMHKSVCSYRGIVIMLEKKGLSSMGSPVLLCYMRVMSFVWSWISLDAAFGCCEVSFSSAVMARCSGSSALTSTSNAVPCWVPSRSMSQMGSSTSSWMVRFSARAPY